MPLQDALARKREDAMPLQDDVTPLTYPAGTWGSIPPPSNCGALQQQLLQPAQPVRGVVNCTDRPSPKRQGCAIRLDSGPARAGGMRPELLLSWASQESPLDNIKLKKTIKVLLVKFTGTAAWSLRTHQLSYKVSCKDTLFNGRITFDPSEKAIDYRKKLPLPFLGNKIGTLVASARWTFNDLNQTWDPSFRFGMEFRHGSAELLSPTSVRFKPRLYLKNIGLEARTLVSLHLPSKLLFDLAHGGSSGALAAPEEDDAVGVNLEVQQLDLVLRL